MVDNLINFFENLSSPMDSDSNFSRKGSSRSMPDTSTSKVKKFVYELTEIKRPSNKHKDTETLLNGKHNTTPRKTINTESKNHDIDFKSTRRKPRSLTSRKVTKEKKVEAFEQIQKEVEKAANYKEAGSTKFYTHRNETKNLEVENDVIKQYEKPKCNCREEQQVSINDQEKKEEKREKTLNVASAELDENLHNNVTHNFEENREEKVDSNDDIFGYNDFSENMEDNFVLETYFENGHTELIRTSLDITRRTLSSNCTEEEIESLVQDSDFVFHREESWISSDAVEDNGLSEDSLYVNLSDLAVSGANYKFDLNNYVQKESFSESEESEYVVLTRQEPIYETLVRSYPTFRRTSENDKQEDIVHHHSNRDNLEEAKISEESNLNKREEPIYEILVKDSPTVRKISESNKQEVCGNSEKTKIIEDHYLKKKEQLICKNRVKSDPTFRRILESDKQEYSCHCDSICLICEEAKMIKEIDFNKKEEPIYERLVRSDPTLQNILENGKQEDNVHSHSSRVNSEETMMTEEVYLNNDKDKKESDKQEDNFYRHSIRVNSEDAKVIEEAFLNKSKEKKSKINYILEELTKTEEKYIKGLSIVVKDYMPFLMSETTHNLLGRTTYIFGNIEAIYENAKLFLELLTETEQEADKIAQLFIDNIEMFELYPLYSKNKPTADRILKEFDEPVKRRQTQLKDKLGLASFLLTPIQRLGKYVLLLEQIQKELKKNQKPLEKISEAIGVVRNVMRKGNDYIAIDSIKQSEIDLRLHGSFIMRAPFAITKPRKMTSMVFLFENIVVFTEKMPKNMEQFRYVDSIQMSDLSLRNIEENSNIFHLTNYTKSKKGTSDATYILEAETPKIKNEWTTVIGEKLWVQLKKAKEQQKKVSYSDHRHKPSRHMSNSDNIRTRSLDRNHKKLERQKSKSKFYDQLED